ncbi:MAG: elongation factor P [Candidatus Edwardsbacteria bacterium]
MIDAGQLRNGMTVELEGELLYITEAHHVKPGKGGAFVRTKLKNIRSGLVIERTFRVGEKLNEVRLERKKMQYLYQNSEIYYLMNGETYEQIALPKELFGENGLYLRENLEITVLMDGEEAIGVEVPFFVDLAVVETEPGFRGDTAQAATKPAKLESGLIVQVPLFIEVGDVIKIDTRTKEYLQRV